MNRLFEWIADVLGIVSIVLLILWARGNITFREHSGTNYKNSDIVYTIDSIECRIAYRVTLCVIEKKIENGAKTKISHVYKEYFNLVYTDKNGVLHKTFIIPDHMITKK